MAEIHDLQCQLTSATLAQKEDHVIAKLANELAKKSIMFFEHQPGQLPSYQRASQLLNAIYESIREDCPHMNAVLRDNTLSFIKSTQDVIIDQAQRTEEDLQRAIAESIKESEAHEQQFDTQASPPSERKDEGRALGSLTFTDIARARQSHQPATAQPDFQQWQQPVVELNQASGYSASPSQAAVPHPQVKSKYGRQLVERFKEAESWTGRYNDEDNVFLSDMDILFKHSQEHMTILCQQGLTPEVKEECDELSKMTRALRNHWGKDRFPNSLCNAFVRERIPIVIEGQNCRVDCAEYFDDLPFYDNNPTMQGNLQKHRRFSVYDEKNTIVARYFLESSDVNQKYYVLCKMLPVPGNPRGQIEPYGSDRPDYWTDRQNMLDSLARNGTTGFPGPHT